MNYNEQKLLEEAKAKWAEACAVATAARDKAEQAQAEAWVAMWDKIEVGKVLAAIQTVVNNVDEDKE